MIVSGRSSAAWASGRDLKAKVAVLLINWNGWRLSAEAYRSLLKSDFRQWVLIIVDNASSDDSLVHLRGLGPEVHIIESRTNLGFSGGCNLALETAEKLGVEFVFFLNNDCTVTQSTLGALVSASIPCVITPFWVPLFATVMMEPCSSFALCHRRHLAYPSSNSRRRRDYLRRKT